MTAEWAAAAITRGWQEWTELGDEENWIAHAQAVRPLDGLPAAGGAGEGEWDLPPRGGDEAARPAGDSRPSGEARQTQTGEEMAEKSPITAAAGSYLTAGGPTRTKIVAVGDRFHVVSPDGETTYGTYREHERALRRQRHILHSSRPRKEKVRAA
jgi:hypothetical protein